MVRNSIVLGTSELELLELFEQTLRAALPRSWTATQVPEERFGEHRPDMVLRIEAPDGAGTTLLVEAKHGVEPRSLPGILEQIKHLTRVADASHALFVSRFLSPLSREKLAEAGVGWFDATGNLRLQTDRPALFVDRAGADRNPFTDPSERRLKSLRGPAAARVVRALCESELPVRVRQFADQARVSVGSSSRVLDLLAREGLLDRGAHGEVVGVRRRSLIQRWVQDYGLTSSNEAASLLDPRGVDHALATLDPADKQHAVTGSAASRSYLPTGVVPVSPLTTLVVHSRRPSEVIRNAGLKRVERGANVLLVKPFDDVLLSGTRVLNGVRCAAPAQVVADLLTGPGRSTEEAEQLIRALATDDRAWSA